MRKASSSFQDLRKKLVGATLKRLRESAKLTQWDVARDIGYTTAQFVSNWERGVSYPPTSALCSIAKSFNFDVKKLVQIIYQCREAELAQEKERALLRVQGRQRVG